MGLPQAVTLTAHTPGETVPAPATPAAPVGAAEPRSLHETIDALRALLGKSDSEPGLFQTEEAQPLVEKSLFFANTATLGELALLSDCFRDLRLRLALRDMMPVISNQLRTAGSEDLQSVLQLLSNLGKGSLFHIELFEFCNQRLGSLDAAGVAVFLYEAGRHGLRCRHLIDAALPRAIELVPDMSINDIMMASQGLVRFSRDWSAFFLAARPRVLAQLQSLSASQLLLGLRVSRDLRHFNEMVDVHSACASGLLLKVPSLSLPQAAQCLMCCTFSPKFRAQAHGLVRCIEQQWTHTEDLSPLRAVEVVDSLDSLSSWGMKSLPLVDRLCDILVERSIELKYAGNVSLWVQATQALSRIEHLNASWPRVALELARDKAVAERPSFYQQCTLVISFARLRLFDETAYKNIAELLISDMGLFKEPQDLGPVLWAFVTVNYPHPGLFDGAYDVVIEWLEAEKLDMSKAGTRHSFVQIVHCLAVAGYHKRYESFVALLDYAFFGAEDLEKERVVNLKRIAQLADIVLIETPELAENSQYHDVMQKVRADPKVRRLISGCPPTDPQLLHEVRTTLQGLGWPYEPFAMPDDTSVSYVDISLEPKLGKKVGLLVAGSYDMCRVGLPDEGLPPRETGHKALARRLIGARGWSLALVTRSEWDAAGVDGRQAFLDEAVQRATCSQGLDGAPQDAEAPGSDA